MRALIVDDEPLARRGIVLRLRKFKDVEIVGECGDGASAVKNILELTPDIIFLDIQMPGMTGFDVLKALPRESLPGVVFLTAYEQHAVRAFEVHAIDYVLKPIDNVRFAAAVLRAQKLVESTSKILIAQKLLKVLDVTQRNFASHLTVQSGSRFRIVPIEEIEWIRAAGDYVELYGRGQCSLLRETMASLERRLDPAKFLRIHRSRIVRAACIRELRSIDNREFTVCLSDGSEHRSSRTYADRLDAWLKSGRMDT